MTRLRNLMENYREKSRILGRPMEPSQSSLMKQLMNVSFVYTESTILILSRVKLTINEGIETS